MKFKKVEFLKSCTSAGQFPDYDHPEFAFLGRSNTGKSSLINMLTGQKNLVKTGSKPGVTRAVNFFLADGALSIADLPGFGYAKIPSEVKKKFLPLIRNYIAERKNLVLAFLLVDIRRVPGEQEREIISLLVEHEVYVAVALTKCDKLTRAKKIESCRIICDALGIGTESAFFTSSKTGEGKKELLGLIMDFRKGVKE